MKIGERRKGSDYDLIRISVKCKTCFMHAKYIDTVTFLAFDFSFYYKILAFDFSVCIYTYIYIYIYKINMIILQIYKVCFMKNVIYYHIKIQISFCLFGVYSLNFRSFFFFFGKV